MSSSESLSPRGLPSLLERCMDTGCSGLTLSSSARVVLPWSSGLRVGVLPSYPCYVLAVPPFDP